MKNLDIYIFIGSPGSGKGSISNMLVERNNCLQISTGKIFRNITKEKILEICNENPSLLTSNNPEDVLSKGNLMSDDLTNEIFKDYLITVSSKNPGKKIILDGYPRTIAQAKFLDENFSVKKIIFLTNISDEKITERLQNRYICRENEHTFSFKNFDRAKNGRCIHDGSELYQRDDDKEDIIKARIETYHKLTVPVINHYQSKKKVFEVDADDSFESVYWKTLNLMNNE